MVAMVLVGTMEAMVLLGTMGAMVLVFSSGKVGSRWGPKSCHQLDPCLATKALDLKMGLASIAPQLDKLTKCCLDKGFLCWKSGVKICSHSWF